jgi:membrane protease YdiL (CAAX protease family)
LALIIVISGQPAISEELVLRGAMFAMLKKAWSPLMTIVITAAFFGLLHIVMGPGRMLAAFIVGLALGLLRWQHGVIYSAVLLHFMLNFGTGIPA